MAKEKVLAPPAPFKQLSARDFVIAQMQASLFTPDEEVSPPKLLRGLIPKWQSPFDGDPFVMPSASGVPREIPRIVLQAKAGDYRCEISSERINVYWLKTVQGSSLPTSFPNDAVRLLNEYAQFVGARVGRMAAVLTRFAVHPKPALFLARHFCKEEWSEAPLNRPENLELHAHKTFLMAKTYMVNSWMRSKTGMVGTPGTSQMAVVVEQDLNTRSEEAATRSFVSSDVGGFFSSARAEFDVILDLYYPTGA